MTEFPAKPILSRPVAVSEIPPSGLTLPLSASDAERAALAAHNNLAAVLALNARVTVTHEGGKGLHALGRFDARVTQICVVSLEPFDTTVDGAIDVHFLTPEGLEVFRAAHPRDAADEDDNGPEEPDPIIGGRIDVGDLVAEHLTLALDLYPRKPGAALAIEPAAADQPESPFAVLRQWREDRS